MKVQIVVKCRSKLETKSEQSIDIVLSPSSTVSELKERVSSLANIFAFPTLSLKFKDSILADSDNFQALGVVEGDVMELFFEACEQTLMQQLSDLLGENTMSLEELNLSYIHRYGTSIEDVRQRMDHVKQELQAFLEHSKCFCFDGDLVKLSPAIDVQAIPSQCNTMKINVSVDWSSARKSPSGSFEDADDSFLHSLEGSITVAEAKKAIAVSELVPFPDLELVLRGRKLKDELSLNEAGVKDGDSLTLAVHASEATLVSQFEQLLHERTALSCNELSLLYCQRFGTSTPQALRSLGLHGSINRFVEKHAAFAMRGGCVTLAHESVLEVAS